MKKTILLISAIVATAFLAGARQPQRGYRGFLEWSSSVRSENFGDFYLDGEFGFRRQTTFYTGLTTSHGYQIDPMFFIGAGLGMERCGSLGNWVAPVFVEGRADFEFGK